MTTAATTPSKSPSEQFKLPAEDERVAVSNLEGLLSALGIEKAAASDADVNPKLFDMGAFACLMGSEFRALIPEFVNNVAGPLIAVYGTNMRVCASPLRRTEYLQSLVSKYPWARELHEKLATRDPRWDTSPLRADWSILVDRLSSRYLERVASEKTGKTGVTSSTPSSSPLTAATTEKSTGLAVTGDAAKAAIRQAEASGQTDVIFFAHFWARINTKDGYAEVQRRVQTSSSKRQPYAFRRAAATWEWNTRVLQDVIFPMALEDNWMHRFPDVKADVLQARKMTTETLHRMEEKRKDAASSGENDDDSDAADGSASGSLPPMPLVFGIPYLEESTLETRAPRAAALLEYLRGRGYPRVLNITGKDAKEEEEDVEEEEEEDEEEEDKQSTTESVSSSTKEEDVAVMGIARPRVPVPDELPPTPTLPSKPRFRDNDDLDALAVHYFDSFPNLQMDCRMVSTLSRSGQGFGSYMFSAEQMMAMCDSVKAVHALSRYDAQCESAYNRWLLSNKHTKDQPSHPPPRTHARQTLLSLACELSAMVSRMQEAEVRLKRFDAQCAAKKKRGGGGEGIKKTARPMDTMFGLPWFENTEINERSHGGYTHRTVSHPTGDYYTAWKDGRKTDNWLAFLSACRARLWALVQSGDYVPLGSLEESDPELAYLIAVHDNQHVANAPLHSHASVFRIDAWTGTLPAQISGYTAKLNRVAHTAVYRAERFVQLKLDDQWHGRKQRLDCLRASPINLCYPLCGPWMTEQASALAPVRAAHPPVAAVKRVKETIASSVALLCAVYKFLLYVSTFAHKVVLLESCGGKYVELASGSIEDYFARIDYGLETAETALREAGDGKHNKEYGVQDVPDHAVYGGGEFGPVTERALKKSPDRKRQFVSTVDPIRILREIARAEGRETAAEHSWNRLVITSRFAFPKRDQSGNEIAAMTTQFMEDLLNITAYRMTAEGWRLHHRADGKQNEMRTAANRAERRRVPLSICANLHALVVCVRECIKTRLLPHFHITRNDLKRVVKRRAKEPLDEYWGSNYYRAVVSERTNQVIELARQYFEPRSIPHIRSHVYASTKAWWAAGVLMCTTEMGSLSTIRAFTATREAIKRCIDACSAAHMAH